MKNLNAINLSISFCIVANAAMALSEPQVVGLHKRGVGSRPVPPGSSVDATATGAPIGSPSSPVEPSAPPYPQKTASAIDYTIPPKPTESPAPDSPRETTATTSLLTTETTTKSTASLATETTNSEISSMEAMIMETITSYGNIYYETTATMDHYSGSYPYAHAADIYDNGEYPDDIVLSGSSVLQLSVGAMFAIVLLSA